MKSQQLLVSALESGLGIRVRLRGDQLGLYADVDFEKDALILMINGVEVGFPTKYSVQIGRNTHIEVPASVNGRDKHTYYWRYLNHHCRPSSYINTVERSLRALRAIRAGEELTYNYNTTEFRMASPFRCRCGTTDCTGFVAGYAALTESQKAQIMGLKAPYL